MSKDFRYITPFREVNGFIAFMYKVFTRDKGKEMKNSKDSKNKVIQDENK